ncbi:hypothetical protein [Streptomyces sp. NPDC013187]|uniref:hypothetical protein n=1 Tax=Streptomyces sp. NPDC013187 TaxID=3364865 RepID=UPI003686ED9F
MSDRVLFYGASQGRGVAAAIDDGNHIGDLTVIPAGSFAKDWTAFTGLSGDRILFYGKTQGRGIVCSIDDDNHIADVTVIPPGSFAKGWTEMSALRPQGSHLRVGRAAEEHHV